MHRSPFDDMLDSAKESAKEVGGKLEKVKGAVVPVTKDADRPLMSSINKMRIELCWKREDLWQHNECLDFLGLKCTDTRTGVGICARFRKKIVNQCVSAKKEVKKAKKKKAKKKARKAVKRWCNMAKYMGEPVPQKTTTTTTASTVTTTSAAPGPPPAAAIEDADGAAIEDADEASA